jgi:uncharacterized membrane protein
VASYPENKAGGLVAQGIGTSMLQVPNIVRKPIIWIPAIVSSALLGPVGSAVLGMTGTPVGSGMGTSGLVGQFAAYASMTEGGRGPGMAVLLILLMHIIFPALLAGIISWFMRKRGWIRQGDMALHV